MKKLLLGFLVFLSACNLLGQPATDTPAESSEPPAPASTATATDPFPNPVMVIVGDHEVVFDWTNDRCAPENLPDLPSRAFRDAAGQVHFIISHFTTYQMIGPSLDELKIDCSPVMASTHDAAPENYTDAEWIASPYTMDGQTVYALVHDEYQGHTHAGQCPQGEYAPCWYNTITLAVSRDGGASYEHAAEPPAHRVAGLPYVYEGGSGPYGLFNPSNIIQGPDDYYYAFARLDKYKTEEQGVCLMRSDDLSDPASWRFWNGSSFSGQFIDPYRDAIGDPRAFDCPPLDWEDIGASLNASITYNTYLNRYVLVGLSADWLDNHEVWGVFYSFSEDLIHWTRRKLLVELPLPWTVENYDDVMYLYPALLDPESESRNFDTTGKTAYMYITRLNFGQGSLDRDLLRFPVEFFPSPKDVPAVNPTPEGEALEAVSLNIIKTDFKVPAGKPVELTLIWETKTADQVADFLTKVQLEIVLDGQVMPNTGDFWGEVTPSGENFSSQWVYPIGILDPGPHQVDVRISVTEPVSDGFGNAYRGTILSNSINIEVEE